MLYVAVLLHDIAKGRGGDHSELGAEVALELCPRFGLDEAETETVAWLVRYHLLLSNTAFRRDIADPKTVEDFVRMVQSPERLRLLLILTVVDIRAVGPTTWNDWKRQLLRTLFDAAEERLRLGHKQRGRAEQVDGPAAGAGGGLAVEAVGSDEPMPAACRTAIGWPNRRNGSSPMPCRWRRPRRISAIPSHRSTAQPDAASGTTRESASSRPTGPGLFYRIAAALSGAGASIIDARIHTTRDGMALDNLLVTDGRGKAYDDPRLRKRLATAVDKALRAEAEPPLPAAGKIAASGTGIRGRAAGAGLRQGVVANHRGGGQCPRPARPARPAGSCHPRRRAPAPFGAYRDLWRAGGRRFLPDLGARAETVRR